MGMLQSNPHKSCSKPTGALSGQGALADGSRGPAAFNLHQIRFNKAHRLIVQATTITQQQFKTGIVFL